MIIASMIERVEIEVFPAKKRIGNIIGFAEMHMITENGEVLFKVKGITIRERCFDGKNTVLTVNAPGYASRGKWWTSFVIENKSLWKDIRGIIISEHQRKTASDNINEFLDCLE